MWQMSRAESKKQQNENCERELHHSKTEAYREEVQVVDDAMWKEKRGKL